MRADVGEEVFNGDKAAANPDRPATVAAPLVRKPRRVRDAGVFCAGLFCSGEFCSGVFFSGMIGL